MSISSILVRELNETEYINRTVIIRGVLINKEKRLGKNGEYTVIVMGDQEHVKECKQWSTEIFDVGIIGRVYDFTVSIKLWDNNPSMVLMGYNEVENCDVSYFLCTRYDTENDYKIIEWAVRNVVQIPEFKIVIEELLLPRIEYFKLAPAAKSMHHIGVGGLMNHTANLIRISVNLQMNVYKWLDIQLLVMGCLMHDVCKLDEMEESTGRIGLMVYNANSALSSHIVMGSEKIAVVAQKYGIDNSENIKMLKHIILAHHGKKEWGSPVLPATGEAWMVHHADLLDADMFRMKDGMDKLEEGTFSTGRWDGNSPFCTYKKIEREQE